MSESEFTIKEDEIIEPKIFQNSKQQNPMLTSLQNKFVWIPCISAKYNSKALLYFWIFVKKLLSILPSKTFAIHGSIFILKITQIKKIHPIFNEDVFLYCEEMFFANKIRINNFKFVKRNIFFNHTGSVSTRKFYDGQDDERFKNWRKSMLKYCYSCKND